VQGDGGLARTGPTLDHLHAAVVGADDPVLFGLDRRDDVPHAAGALLGDRGQQGALTLQDRSVPAVGTVQHPPVEHVVLEAGHGAVVGDQVATQLHAHPVAAGGLVVGGRRRGAPVDQELFPRGGEQSDPADVSMLALIGVQAAEHHVVGHGPQQGQPVLVHGHERIPFGTVLMRRGVLGALHRGQVVLDLCDQLVDAAVQDVHVVLFMGDLP
jgi:hypothetical protein